MVLIFCTTVPMLYNSSYAFDRLVKWLKKSFIKFIVSFKINDRVFYQFPQVYKKNLHDLRLIGYKVIARTRLSVFRSFQMGAYSRGGLTGTEGEMQWHYRNLQYNNY